MAPSSDPRFREKELQPPVEPKRPDKSIRLTPGKQQQIEDALALLASHYGDALASWHSLTPEQRTALLEHSPLLAKLLELVRPALEGELWPR